MMKSLVGFDIFVFIGMVEMEKNMPAIPMKTLVSEDELATTVNLSVGGWRIDVRFSKSRDGVNFVNIANVSFDGDEAGWCAVAYDSTLPGCAPLSLNGDERE